jgi:hypothetical protein
LRIAIQNATDRPDASTILSEKLRQAGFRNVYTIRDSTQLIGATAIVAQRGDLEAAATLQSLLGIGRVEADSTGDLESDLTIRIGLDSENLNLDEWVIPSLAQP